MGANSPFFPDSVLSETQGIQYLGSVVNAQRLGLYANVTGSPALTAAQMVGGAVAVGGGAAATATTDTAALIVARIKAVKPGAVAGATSHFHLLNDNTGILTLAPGAGVTISGDGANLIPPGSSRRYLITMVSDTAVTLSPM